MHVNAFGLFDLKITPMRWNQRYVLGSYLRFSLWVVPFFAIPLALIAVRVLHRLDIWLGWSLLGLDTAGAKTLFEAFVSATLAFVVFTFGYAVGRDSGRQRTIDAADHRHDIAAERAHHMCRDVSYRSCPRLSFS
jgi:hypothetical protein